jgi:hypothetical protein
MPRPAGRSSNFASDTHVLYCGWVMGHMARAGLPFQPVLDDEGNYTNRVEVTTLEGVVVTLIVPPPPDDWRFDYSAPQTPTPTIPIVTAETS